MHKIDWCERGLQLEDISTKTVGNNDLNPRMKYIMERLDNWEQLCKRGDRLHASLSNKSYVWLDYI